MIMLASNHLDGFDYDSCLQPDEHYWLSPKLDGVRVLITEPTFSNKLGEETKVWTRNGKPLMGRHISNILSQLPIGCDGELTPTDPRGSATFAKAQSLASTIHGEPTDWTYYIFNFNSGPSEGYSVRMAKLSVWLMQQSAKLRQHVQIVHMEPHWTFAEVLDASKSLYMGGYEGGMVTTSNALYIDGRVPATKPYALKIKPREDAEFEVIGFAEATYSGKKATEAGLAGQGKGELGALILRDPTGKYLDFNCGTGYNAEQRKTIWANQAEYLGKFATINFQLAGTTDRPRQPSFKGFRIDL